MWSLIWAVLVWVVLFAATVVTAHSRGLAYWQALGMFVPVSVMWGLWAAGYLLSARRRSGVLAVLGRFSTWLQQAVRRG